MISWIKRFLGLKGSWMWACRQMKKGVWVRRVIASGTVKYKLDHEGQGRIMWTFARHSKSNSDWEEAYIFLDDFEATDWVCVDRLENRVEA